MQVASAGGGYLTAANREQALSALGKKPHRSDPGVSRSSEEARTKLRKRWREVIQRGWLGEEPGAPLSPVVRGVAPESPLHNRSTT